MRFFARLIPSWLDVFLKMSSIRIPVTAEIAIIPGQGPRDGKRREERVEDRAEDRVEEAHQPM